MSDMAIDAARMMDMLPDEDKNFAYEFIKKLVKAWADSDIDWDHLSAIV